MDRRQDDQQSKKEKLSAKLTKEVLLHFRNLINEDFSSYTVERNKTDYPQARADLSIFDGSGSLVIEGREFSGGKTSVWLKRYDAVATTQAARAPAL